MRESTKTIVDYWKRRKKLMLIGFGSKCQICGYNKCDSALEFHHLNPEEKEIAISSQIRSWEKTKEELEKCICVCANCHREIHSGIIKIDTNKKYFNKELVSGYNPNHPKGEEYYDLCPVCGKKKLKTKRACCRTCFGKLREKTNWNNIDLIKLVECDKKSYSSIGKIVGVSGVSVKKRYDKIKKFL